MPPLYGFRLLRFELGTTTLFLQKESELLFFLLPFLGNRCHYWLLVILRRCVARCLHLTGQQLGEVAGFTTVRAG
jgi:hypothetical protein